MQERMDRREVYDTIMDAIAEIYSSLEIIEDTLKEGGFDGALKRAKLYWLAHIDGALLNQYGNLGGSFISAKDTIEEIVNDDDSIYHTNSYFER